MCRNCNTEMVSKVGAACRIACAIFEDLPYGPMLSDERGLPADNRTWCLCVPRFTGVHLRTHGLVTDCVAEETSCIPPL